MKNLIILLSLIFICSIGLSAQPRRPGTSGSPAPLKVEVEADDDPLANFAEKGVPEPAVLGLRPSAALARTVAPRILKNDQDSLSVLTAALQKAGFHIIDTNQKILYRPTSTPNGAVFYDFEVAGMLRATGLGFATTIETLGRMIDKETAGLPQSRFPQLILEDLRSARTSQDPQTQFIAGLIFELGKGMSDLSTAIPAQARINLIQSSLIERVFLGDLMDAYETFTEQNASLTPRRRIFSQDREPRFLPASWNFRRSEPCETISNVSTLAGYEGKMKKVGGKIFDKKSIPSIFTAPKEQFKAKFGALAEGIEVANVVMSWAKLVMANMSIRANITVEDPIPLIRTQRSDEWGQARIVTAKFGIDFKNSETINCVGKAVKTMTGLNVEVPKDGPMRNVPVKWLPVHTGSGNSRFVLPVDIVAVDKEKGDISRQVTNDVGESQIKLIGRPQPTNLVGTPVVPLAKKVSLTVNVATENMDAKKDIPKLLWGGFEGGSEIIENNVNPAKKIALTILGIVPEMIAKMPLKGYKVGVPVRDWQPCSEDWGGFINYRKTLSKTVVVKSNRSSNGNSTGDGIRRIEKEETVNITLNPRTPEEIQAKKAIRPADFRVSGKYMETFDGSRDGDPCCGPAEGTYATKFRDGSRTNFLGSFQREMSLSFYGGDRDYSLGFNFVTDPVPAHRYSFHEILETNCPLEYNEESSEESEGEIMLEGSLAPGRYGERLLNSAGDLLQGTKQVQAPDGSTVTWEWGLARCKTVR